MAADHRPAALLGLTPPPTTSAPNESHWPSAAICNGTGIKSSSGSWNAIEAEMPADKAIHVILNYASHKQSKVRACLARHPRWSFHFVSTACSWLSAVEGFFARPTRPQLKNGIFHSVVDLQAAINRLIQEPRPFVWKANPAKSSPPLSAGIKCWD